MNTTITTPIGNNSFSSLSQVTIPNSNTSIVTNESKDVVKFWIQGILLMVVGVLGFIGNTGGMIHFSSKNLYKRKFEALMFWLALWDNVFIICAMMGYAIPEYLEFLKIEMGEYIAYVQPWLLPIVQFSITGNILFTMAISIERYFVICKPLLHRANYRDKSSVRYIISLIIFAIIYNLTKFFEWETIVIDDDIEGKFYELDRNAYILVILKAIEKQII